MSRPRHILQVVADGAPGGGTTAVLSLSKSLANAGWQVSLATQADSYALEEAAKIGLRSHGLAFFPQRAAAAISRQLARIIYDESAEIIHVHGGRAMSAFCLPPLLRLAKPVIYTVHGYHFVHKTGAAKWAGWAAEFVMARRAKHMIFVGENDRKIAQAAKLLPRGVATSTIRNGVNPDDFPTNQTAPPTHDLVFAGRMHHQKNPGFAIEIMKALQGTGISLLMIGGGELEAEIRRLAARHGVLEAITFTGALPRTDTLASLQKARLYLFPSVWEGLPIGPIEAMMLGLPVIGSNIPGTDEVVAHGQTGILITGFHPAAYAAAIRSLLNDQDLLERMAKAARHRAARHFNQHKNVAEHLALYNAVTA
jgi:glycosyltransferase involved in cell wall biosynthesis